jgi:nicotinamide mononucleotide transporter
MWLSLVGDTVQTFLQDVQAARWQEWVSSIAQIASVWYAGKNNILVYPTGIIGVLLAFWLYLFMAHPPLYADGILNLYYFGMSVYGWYEWTRKDDQNTLLRPISRCTNRELAYGIIGFLIGWGLIYFILVEATDSNTPILDSMVTSTACTAMWWMARRKTENWIAWIVSNLVAIPLNYYKGFMLFSVMYILFLFLAINGFLQWKKSLPSSRVSTN